MKFLATTKTDSVLSNPEDRALVDQQARISADSIVGHSSRVEKSAVIKGSIVGRHCVIGEAAVLTGCVVLDHCVVGPRCVFACISTYYLQTHVLFLVRRAKLDGCILGKQSKIGSDAALVQCVTQAGYEVSDGGESVAGSWCDDILC